MSNGNQGASALTVSREEYRRRNNRVACILQQRWPCQRDRPVGGAAAGQTASRGLHYPAPLIFGPAGHRRRGAEPVSGQSEPPTVPVLSADGRPVGRRHIVDGLTPVTIDQSGAVTGRPLWIAPGSPIDRANPGAAEQLNPTHQPAQHQVVADHRKIEAGE